MMSGKVGWLDVFVIYVALAVFRLYRDLKTADKKNLCNSSGENGNRTPDQAKYGSLLYIFIYLDHMYTHRIWSSSCCGDTNSFLSLRPSLSRSCFREAYSYNRLASSGNWSAFSFISSIISPQAQGWHWYALKSIRVSVFPIWTPFFLLPSKVKPELQIIETRIGFSCPFQSVVIYSINEFDEKGILKPWSQNPLLQRLLKLAGFRDMTVLPYNSKEHFHRALKCLKMQIQRFLCPFSHFAGRYSMARKWPDENFGDVGQRSRSWVGNLGETVVGAFSPLFFNEFL